MLNRIVTKFGGSSLADAGQFRKVRDILELEPARSYVVPSAPGKRFDGDEKVTDMLYQCWRTASAGGDFSGTFKKVGDRYRDIVRELRLDTDIESILEEINFRIAGGAGADWCASRGEYLNGRLLADFLDWRFLDAAEGIRFDADGMFDSEATQEKLSALLSHGEPTVVPGFYGAMPDGTIRTFSRGGSDITGAIVARAVNADVYENWTDVSGFLMADPRIVSNPAEISSITYKELREMSYMGASVLHQEAMFPVQRVGIPTNIRNTGKPFHPGTFITSSVPNEISVPTITGIAGRKGFTVLSVEKARMSGDGSFGRKVLQILESEQINIEHMPIGIDALSAVVPSEELEGKLDRVLERIRQETAPDQLTVHDHMAIIATVGRGMVHNCGTAARLFSAMSKARINVRMIEQGSSELSILVGVDDSDFENTIRAIYHEFVG